MVQNCKKSGAYLPRSSIGYDPDTLFIEPWPAPVAQ